jgi:trigger factor
MMSDQKQVDNNYRKVLTDKLFNFLETQVSPGEKQSSPEELMAMQHHHHH